MDAKKYLEPEQFRQWLASFKPGRRVGKARIPDECPLARYLRRRTKEKTIGVWKDFLGIFGLPVEFMPEWAKRFVQRIDVDRRVGEEVTAAEALADLEEVLQEDGNNG